MFSRNTTTIQVLLLFQMTLIVVICTWYSSVPVRMVRIVCTCWSLVFKEPGEQPLEVNPTNRTSVILLYTETTNERSKQMSGTR